MKFKIRRATPEDGPALGKMGAALAEQHHDFDRQRFMLPPDLESGYRSWLVREAENAKAIVLVAEAEGGAIIGYAYGRLEERDWNALRDACGGFHDLWVKEEARFFGAGGALARAMIEAFEKLGTPRVVLMTAAKNGHAQDLFERLGWRKTMIEMTRESQLPPTPPKKA